MLMHIFFLAPKNLWIGATDKDSKVKGKRPFYWLSSGKDVSYSYWSPGQPDNYNYNHDPEHCVGTWDKTNFMWNDFSCDTKIGFLCEESENLKVRNECRQQRLVEASRLEQINEFRELSNKLEQAIEDNTNSVEKMQLEFTESVEELQNQTQRQIYKLISGEHHSLFQKIKDIIHDHAVAEAADSSCTVYSSFGIDSKDASHLRIWYIWN